MPTKYKPVPRKAAAHSDEAARQLLGISKATFFRKIREGVLMPPGPGFGTKRRWWTPADIALAREQLQGE